MKKYLASKQKATALSAADTVRQIYEQTSTFSPPNGFQAALPFSYFDQSSYRDKLAAKLSASNSFISMKIQPSSHHTPRKLDSVALSGIVNNLFRISYIYVHYTI